MGDSRFASLVAGIAAGNPGDGAAAEVDRPAQRSDHEETGGQTGEDDGAAQMVRRTYQIRPAPPMGMSFAKDIARRHGISFEQLAQELHDRQKEEK